jgi:tetratricopeptide (TPR) repeat protein
LEKRKKLLKRARIQYVKSQKLDSSIPETYAMYGSTYFPNGQKQAKSVESIEHANRMLPGSKDILHLLAMAYLSNGRTEDAGAIVNRIMSAPHASQTMVDDVLEEMKRTLEFEPVDQEH